MPTSWITSACAWAKSHLVALAVSAAGLAVGIGIVVLAAADSRKDMKRADDPNLVVDEWKTNINRLGLKAVFPTREDFFVGDLYAFDPDAAPGNGISSMQIAHVAAADDAVRAAYSGLPRFPPSPKDYDWVSPVDARLNIFTTAGQLLSLPIVAFPDITIATATTRTVAAGLPKGRGKFGASHTMSENVVVRFPEAETYGIPADDANALLNKFCAPESGPINPTCGQRRVRDLLSSVVGGDVLCPKNPARPSVSPPHAVELAFVYRVYLTRSIDYAYGSDTAVASEAKAILDRPASGESPTVNSTGPDARTPQERVNDDLEHLSHTISGIGVGGELSFGSATGNGIVFKRKFARPLAFAYAAIFRDAFDDDCFGPPAAKEADQK
jgi:hypothetical protein